MIQHRLICAIFNEFFKVNILKNYYEIFTFYGQVYVRVLIWVQLYEADTILRESVTNNMQFLLVSGRGGGGGKYRERGGGGVKRAKEGPVYTKKNMLGI